MPLRSGSFLGLVSLGFSLAALGSTTGREMCQMSALCGLKLALMPFLYETYAAWQGCSVDAKFIAFIAFPIHPSGEK